MPLGTEQPLINNGKEGFFYVSVLSCNCLLETLAAHFSKVCCGFLCREKRTLGEISCSLIPVLSTKSGAIFPTGRKRLHCQLRYPLVRFRTTLSVSPTTDVGNRQDGDCSPVSMAFAQLI